MVYFKTHKILVRYCHTAQTFEFTKYPIVYFLCPGVPYSSAHVVTDVIKKKKKKFTIA